MGCGNSKALTAAATKTDVRLPTLIPSGDARTFTPADAKGGQPYEASKTALLMIEFQNEFTTEGGKLHDGVKGVMSSTGMLQNAAHACEAARKSGCKVMHTPIIFAKDLSDNPNKGLGILKGCADGGLFLEGTWNAEFCEQMAPKPSDIIVRGKKGLDAFPGTDLESLLVENGIETLVIGGFLTNCCVESTMRTACEKGFNVVTLIDCCATTSEEGHKAAVEGTFGMFSSPMASTEFLQKIAPSSKPRGGLQVAKPAGNTRTFTAKAAKGGLSCVASKTALLMIEFQNEFTTEGGKLHDGVKGVMSSTSMLQNAVQACEAARKSGCKVMHTPIIFAKDMSDNPNKGLGILKGCADGGLFLEGSWNAEFCEQMAPKLGDIIVRGKKGLDAFPGTDLESLLVENGIETLAIGGFLTNCCVESTMRTACEKGFNVVTLTDCCATTSEEGHKAAVEGTFGMFSCPMKSTAFLSSLQ
jgi:nicotinamidase-related amidase